MIMRLLAVLLSLAFAAEPPFTVATPKGWSATPTEDGLRLAGKPSREGFTPLIVVKKESGDMDAWLAQQDDAKAIAKLPGWKTGPVSATTVGGRAAKRFARSSSEFYPPHARNTKEIPIAEEHVVLAAQDGFWHLYSYAPKSAAASQKKAFAAVLESFRVK